MYHTRFVILQLKSSMSNTTPDDVIETTSSEEDEDVVHHGHGIHNARCNECGGFIFWKHERWTPSGSTHWTTPTRCTCRQMLSELPPTTLQDIETAVKEGKQVSVMYLPTFGELTITSPIIKTPEDMEAFETDVVGKLLTFRGCRVGNEIKRYVSEDAFNKYFTTSSHNLVIL